MAGIALKGKEEIDVYAQKLETGEIRNAGEISANELFIVSALGDDFLVAGANDYSNAAGAIKAKLNSSSVIIDSISGEKSEIGQNEIETLNQGIDPDSAKELEKNYSKEDSPKESWKTMDPNDPNYGERKFGKDSPEIDEGKKRKDKDPTKYYKDEKREQDTVTKHDAITKKFHRMEGDPTENKKNQDDEISKLYKNDESTITGMSISEMLNI